jgi:hypothetical protein
MRSLSLLTALVLGVAIPAGASSVVCSTATGTSNVFTNQSCSPLFTPTALLDWGAPIQGSLTGTNLGGLGPASTSVWPQAVGSTINAAIDGDRFTITSDDQIERADNADLAWSNVFNAWVPASFAAPGNRFFSGHFNGATTPTSTPATGDNLLGVIAPSGASHGSPTLTLTFQVALNYVAFEVSSKTNANFTATLAAFDSLGHQIGTYKIQDTGDGGNCAGLAMSPPQPCNSAPLIQFYDPNDKIVSVELTMVDDTTGLFIDELEVAPIPEPRSIVLIGFGMALTLWLVKRKKLVASAAETSVQA